MYEAAPTDDFAAVRKTVETSIGAKLEDVFDRKLGDLPGFDEKPLSSASIAQVHVAYLKNGQKVAVKVQHSWLKEEAAIDIFVVETLANTGKRMFPAFDYDFIIKDMKKNVPEELDFRVEASNAITISKLLKDDSRVKIPHIYEGLSSVA